MDPGTETQYLSRQYADAVAATGGIPVLLPLLEDPGVLAPLVARLDGVLLTGSSSDIDPAHYGAERQAACGAIQPLRDRLDFMLLDAAFNRGLPVLAICFGMQSLNVFLGGSLMQDIPTAVAGALEHQNPGSEGRPSHAIDIARGSLLESLAGGTRAEVNSTHHQAIDRVAQDLEVIARAPDGVVEAVACRPGGPPVVAVQWHPERSFALDELSRNLFEHFLDCCRSSVTA
jgi:putative glutamine amidotransferase